MTYFSVDVETTGLIPFIHNTTALSVIEFDTGEHFTCRISEPEGGWNWDPFTLKWAEDNIPPSIERWPEFEPRIAVEGIIELLSRFEKPWTFVAWPASFDYPCLQEVFYRAGTIIPFHYRTFDVKSYLCGKYDLDIASSRDEVNEAAGFELWVEPEVPHDPYNDAEAQLITCKRAMNDRLGNHDS